MKRSELRRGEPLRADPAKQRAWQQRTRARLAPRSARRAAEASERRRVVAAVIARDGGCRGRTVWPEVRCGGPLDGHEPGLRSRGADYLNPDEIICLCRLHHDAAHQHQAKALELGLLW